MNDRIATIEKNVNNLTSQLNQAKGSIDQLKKQKKTVAINIKKMEKEKERHEQAVEVLSLVQKITRDSTKNEFELLVTYALQYILDDDYKFVLELDRRGNLQELNFKIITPECPEGLELTTENSGGILDIVSLALRVVLMEVSVPKVDGFIILDESFKHLSVKYREKACNFIGELNKSLKRQIIFISHQEEFINNPDYKAIEIK